MVRAVGMGAGPIGLAVGASSGTRINAAPITINPMKPISTHGRELIDMLSLSAVGATPAVAQGGARPPLQSLWRWNDQLLSHVDAIPRQMVDLLNGLHGHVVALRQR